jgi:hypothetical protein
MHSVTTAVRSLVFLGSCRELLAVGEASIDFVLISSLQIFIRKILPFINIWEVTAKVDLEMYISLPVNSLLFCYV